MKEIQQKVSDVKRKKCRHDVHGELMGYKSVPRCGKTFGICAIDVISSQSNLGLANQRFLFQIQRVT